MKNVMIFEKFEAKLGYNKATVDADPYVNQGLTDEIKKQAMKEIPEIVANYGRTEKVNHLQTVMNHLWEDNDLKHTVGDINGGYRKLEVFVKDWIKNNMQADIKRWLEHPKYPNGANENV